jgi:hypothetical protein
MKRVGGARRTFRTLLVDANGLSRWGLDLQPRFEPPGDPVQVDVLDAQGKVLTRVSAFEERYGEGERAIFVPEARPGWHAVRAAGATTALLAERTRNTPFRR